MDTLTNAVNTCLRGAGLRPVASYNDTNLNAATALAAIQGASRDVQKRGWWFNEEKGWRLFPDSNGQIKAPNNILDVTSWNGSVDKALTVRGGLIYNTLTHSNNLLDSVGPDGAIEFIFITLLDYEDLPAIAQDAITAQAKRQFVADIDGDVNKTKVNMMDEKKASDELYSAQQRNVKQNASQNPTIANFMARMGGQNSRTYGTNYNTYGTLFPEKVNQQ